MWTNESESLISKIIYYWTRWWIVGKINRNIAKWRKRQFLLSVNKNFMILNMLIRCWFIQWKFTPDLGQNAAFWVFQKLVQICFASSWFFKRFFLIFDAYNYLIKKIEVKHPHLSAVLNGWKNIQNFSEKTR